MKFFRHSSRLHVFFRFSATLFTFQLQKELRVISISTDGLSLPYLLSLSGTTSSVLPILDYVHHLKLLLGPLRRLKRLSRGPVSTSLRIILSEFSRNNKHFQHLTTSVHIVPDDDQAVAPCLELISAATRNGLRALATMESLLLADFFELVERYFQAFDVKRTKLSESNPEGRPVASIAERLNELEIIVPAIQKVSSFCLCTPSPNIVAVQWFDAPECQRA